MLNHPRKMRKRLARRCPSQTYPCVGGPYHGQDLNVTANSGGCATAWFRAGAQVGRYTKQPQQGFNAVLQWENREQRNENAETENPEAVLSDRTR